jgi:hypothetical protein
MSAEVTAVLAFCEGPHDVAFVRRVLRQSVGFERVEWRFSEFPAPFNSLFKASMNRHAARDLSLDMAHKFYLPDHVLQRGDHIALLFNAGGKTKWEQIREFLGEYSDLLDQARVFPGDARSVVTRSLVLFLHDADSDGAETIRDAVRQQFSKLGDRDWMTVEWEVDASNGVAATAQDIGSYVWCGEDGLGTLEDLLIPIHRVSDAERTGKAEQCLDQLFEWETDHQDAKRRIAERARRHKGVITLLGQRKKPGMSQHVVIGQTQTMKDADFIGDSRVAAFASFMTRFLDLGVSA